MTTNPQSTTETLEPCPFCGKEAKGFWNGPYVHISGPPDSLQFYSIVCNACCSTAAYESKDRAVNAWNTRVPASAAPVVDNLVATLTSIENNAPECECEHDDEYCCVAVGEFCARCFAHVALVDYRAAAATAAPVEQSEAMRRARDWLKTYEAEKNYEGVDQMFRYVAQLITDLLHERTR